MHSQTSMTNDKLYLSTTELRADDGYQMNGKANNLNHTPISKAKGVFKSPAPSNKKYLINNKSPMVSNLSKINGSNNKSGSNGVENWMISPVCSRLKDHIYMLNGIS